MDLAPQDLAWLAALLLLAGLLAGTLAGLLGVGGGIVIVPVLYQIFTSLGYVADTRMHVAVGTSLATIVLTAWRSARSHHARGALDTALLRGLLLPVAVGVGVGSIAGGELSGRELTLVFAVVALVVAAYMGLAGEGWRLTDAPPEGAARALVGATLGLLSVLMGLGGGTLGVPLLTLCGVPMRRAVGTAAGLGLVVAIPGALGFALSGLGVAGRPPLSLGYVNLVGFALIVPATVLSAPLGARLAHAIPQPLLRRLFAVFLALTSARMFADVL